MAERPLVEERRPRLIGPRIAGSVPVAPSVPLVTGQADQLLLTAIESHLGSSYHYAGTGPDAFDCSGFVWRTFQDVGLNFQRGPANSYWASFAAPPREEQFKFGTLVFFSGLNHVGIVADEKGFYHSSRHNGVIYSPFNDYWLSRIDGFRRVPLESMPLPAATAKPRAAKPAANVEEDNEP
jgi:cell wall-associated NlpC family hydrolase